MPHYVPGYTDEYFAPVQQINITREDIKESSMISGDYLESGELEKLISVINTASVPMYLFRLYEKPLFHQTGIEIGGITLRCSSECIRKLKGSTQMAVIVCTLGNNVTAAYQKLVEKGAMLEAYFYDCMANILINKLLCEAKKKLHQTVVGNGNNITNLFSPGNWEWDIKEQLLLLSLLPPEPCGIKLSDSFLMTPAKSQSGIIGIGEKVIHENKSCSFCKLRTCIYRGKR